MTAPTTHEFLIGQDTFIHSFSPTQNFGVAFEDDMTTGVFYAINKSEQPEVWDGLHIYNVADITEKTLPTQLQITWSEDGWTAFWSSTIITTLFLILEQKQVIVEMVYRKIPATGRWLLSGSLRKRLWQNISWSMKIVCECLGFLIW